MLKGFLTSAAKGGHKTADKNVCRTIFSNISQSPLKRLVVVVVGGSDVSRGGMAWCSGWTLGSQGDCGGINYLLTKIMGTDKIPHNKVVSDIYR